MMAQHKMERVPHFIDGEFVSGAKVLRRRSPLNPKIRYIVDCGSQETVDLAVAAAARAQPAWSALPTSERATMLARWADWLVEQYGDPGEPTALKRRINECMGKPLAEADIEVIETSDFIRYYCESASAILTAETLKLDQNLWKSKRSIVVHEPYGVVAIIKPWNYPLEMIAWSLFPALLAGNTVVIKPSEKAAIVAATFASMAIELGLPPGVLNIVQGDRATGRLLVASPSVNFVTFTGSVQAGRDIAQSCAGRLAPCSLELGGNDVAIVLADSDVELAANGLAWGAFCNAGQVCVGTKKAYVDGKIYSSIVSALRARLDTIRPILDVGPIVDDVQYRSIREYVLDAVNKGAVSYTGSEDRKNKLYYPPTILTEVPASSRLLNEECFGPILPLIPFDDLSEVIRQTNASLYGLGASVWSSDHSKADAVARQLDVGMVWINDVNVAFPQAPWGGTKASGSSFELGTEAVRKFTRPKHICDETSDEPRRSWWYPY